MGLTPGLETEAQEARELVLPLRAVDRLLLAFLGGLAAVAAATHPQPMPLIASAAGLAAAVLVGAAIGTREGWGRVMHAFAPLPIIIVSFNLCGPIIEHANLSRWDAALAALDVRIFGSLVGAWRNALGRPSLLTDAASLAYASYYVIPFAMAVALWARGRRADYDQLVFTMVGTLLASYASYFLFPALGPRVPHDLEAQVLGGGRISSAVRAFVALSEGNRLDAFPSAHTALSLVFLAQGFQLFPRWRWRLPLLAAVSSIVFSTVYLSWHYVVDIAAGAAFAVLMMVAVLPLLRWTFGFAPPAEGPARSPAA
jgi:membrane-associated phospholipid phosphatase